MPRIRVDLDHVGEGIDEATGEFLLDVANTLVNELKRESPVGATSDLQRSWQIFFTGDGSVVLGSRIDYADDVLRGTDPHKPDFERIQVWARRVLGDESAAGAVWNKIATEGTEPNDYLSRAIDNTLEQYQ